MRRRLVVVVCGLLVTISLTVVAAHGTVSLGFATETASVDPGGETQVSIFATEADDGVDSIDLSASIDTPDIAEITAVTVAGDPTTATTNVSSNGTHVEVSASGLDQAGPTVSVVTLTLAGRSTGTGELSIDAGTVSPARGAPYLTAQLDTIEIDVRDGAGSQERLALIGAVVLGGVFVVLAAYVVRKRQEP
jgi:hypothetical protein